MSTVNTTDKTLTLKDGATVSYTIYNGDPESRKLPLIFIMGMTGIKEDFGLVPSTISNKGRNVIIFDNRNIGNSYGDISNLSINLMAKDTIELIQHLGYKAVDILGFSMGGVIILDMFFNHKRDFEINKILFTSSCSRKPLNLKINMDVGSDSGFFGFLDKLYDDKWVKENQIILKLIKERFASSRRPRDTVGKQALSLSAFNYTNQLQQYDFTNKLYVFHGKLDQILFYEEAKHTINSSVGVTHYTKLPSLDYGHMWPSYFTPEIWADSFIECLDATSKSNL